MPIFKHRFFTILMASVFILLGGSWLVFARGGGGGSGSGGGGGGGGNLASNLIIFVIVVAVSIIALVARRKAIARADKIIHMAEKVDPVWKEDNLRKRVGEIFLKFQEAWTSFDVEGMKDFLTENYRRRIVLELNVLKNQRRQNVVVRPTIVSIEILKAIDEADNKKDTFIAEIRAWAEDILLDTETGLNLFMDKGSFTEYWIFQREGDVWKLDLIKQATEAPSLVDQSIADFSKKNGFFYDPDFGWLMMPDKGVIFHKSNFGVSDINNHVIGYFRDKIVEFYTYWPNAKSSYGNTHYLVAQAILPIDYNNILVRRKRFFNLTPRGLRKLTLESGDFNRRFCLYANPDDQVSSFELLSPNFMEKIYNLPFELNIEIVGNFLYFYTKDRGASNYDQMLEIITWAFDEMKM